MKKASLLLSASLVVMTNLSLSAQKKEKELIYQTFANYKTALHRHQGEEAVKYVDSRTIAYHDSIIHLAKTADSLRVDSLKVIDKLLVLSIRHRIPREEILAMDGTTFFIYGVQHNMISNYNIVNNSLGKIKIDDHFATADLLLDENKTPKDFHFHKEDDHWKIDLTSLHASTNSEFEVLIAERKQTENDYLFNLIEIVTRKRPGKEVWKPIQ